MLCALSAMYGNRSDLFPSVHISRMQPKSTCKYLSYLASPLLTPPTHRSHTSLLTYGTSPLATYGLGAHPPRPFPESNMARTTAVPTLGAPHPCHASTLHATLGGSHHNSIGARPSRTPCAAWRSDLLPLVPYGSVSSTAHSSLPAHHSASPATSLGLRSSAARAHRWCHKFAPSLSPSSVVPEA